MEFNFAPIPESSALPLVPPGVYLVEVAEVRTRLNQEGSEMWGLRLVVAGGKYKGTTAAWDNLIWSPKGIGRVKRALRLMGFPVDGKLTLEPKDLVGRRVRVRLVPDHFKDPVTGEERARNRVPFGGYLEPEEDRREEEQEAPREDIPF